MFDGETETDLNPAMQERARGANLTMRRPQWSPNTLYAHETTLYAQEQSPQAAHRFHHIAAAAYWQTGADLGSLDTIQTLAQTANLNWTELAPRLQSGHYRPAVLESHQTARTAGITGTPTYQINGWRKFGDLSTQELKTIIQATTP